MNKKIVFLLSLILVIASCDDLIEPAIQNNRPIDDIYSDPAFAHGLLLNGYARIPTNGWDYSDLATDNAVANDEGNGFYGLANGQWAANDNPVDQWQNSKAAIQYLNILLQEVEKVTFSDTEIVDAMFTERIKGEAYGLRALFMYYLLRAHGGISNGNLLGVPIVLDPETIDSDFNQPRASFEDCMTQLYEDAQRAIDLLPLDYASVSNTASIPAKFSGLGASSDQFNRVYGDDGLQLLSGRIVLAIRAQAALMAASPAFSGSGTTWEDAANYAAEVIDLNGGIAGVAIDGHTWFANTAEIDGVGSGLNPPEILWRTDLGGPGSNLEEDNFPPTLFGGGLINPTQNFVDAFPMADGYPINHPSSTYNPTDPYTGRDPRLQEFVLVNGATAGVNNSTIFTSVDGGTDDGLNADVTSTRTGYYLKKLLRQDVNLNPATPNEQLHINPRIRYTEIYLAYAEAANEAFGPTGTGGNAYSALDVIGEIRERAGVGLGNSDAYLQSISGDQAAMRELIRNERRLELSFEGFRFWDLRRWDEDLTETALGVRIESGNYQVIDVDNRVFSDYMTYGPVPYDETLKFSALQQNDGW